MAETDTPGLTADEVAQAVALLDRLEEVANRVYDAKRAYLEALGSKQEPVHGEPLWSADRLWATTAATSDEHDRHLRIIRAVWRMVRQLGPERTRGYRQTAGTSWGDPNPTTIVVKALTQRAQPPWRDENLDDPDLRARTARDYDTCMTSRCPHCGTIDLRYLRYTRVHNDRPEYRGFLACSLCGLTTEFSPPPPEPPPVEEAPATEVRYVAPAEPAVVKRRQQPLERFSVARLAELQRARLPTPKPPYQEDDTKNWIRTELDGTTTVIAHRHDKSLRQRAPRKNEVTCWACDGDQPHSREFHDERMRELFLKSHHARVSDDGSTTSYTPMDVAIADDEEGA